MDQCSTTWDISGHFRYFCDLVDHISRLVLSLAFRLNQWLTQVLLFHHCSSLML